MGPGEIMTCLARPKLTLVQVLLPGSVARYRRRLYRCPLRRTGQKAVRALEEVVAQLNKARSALGLVLAPHVDRATSICKRTALATFSMRLQWPWHRRVGTLCRCLSVCAALSRTAASECGVEGSTGLHGFDAVGPCELRSEVTPDTSLGRARCA